MIKHDQGITCTIMTILLLAALSYLSVNAQEAHAIEEKTAEIVAANAPLDAPNPQEHGNLLFEFNDRMQIENLFSAIVTSEHGSSMVAHVLQHLPSYLRAIFSNR